MKKYKSSFGGKGKGRNGWPDIMNKEKSLYNRDFSMFVSAGRRHLKLY